MHESFCLLRGLGPVCFMRLLHKSRGLMGLKKQTVTYFLTKSLFESKEKKLSRKVFFRLIPPYPAGPTHHHTHRDPLPLPGARMCMAACMHADACRGSRVISLAHLMTFSPSNS